MHFHLALGAAAIALGAAGCASYEESPLDPGAAMAALWSRTVPSYAVERASAAPGRAPPGAFDPSDGLDEAELVAVALTLNPDLQAKRLERGEAEALLISAGLWPNPVLAAGFRPGIGAPSTSIDAEILFELLRPWERAARKAAASARADEAGAAAAADEWDVASRVRAAHLDVLVAEQSLRLLEDEEALRRQVLDLARRGREAGERTALDVAAAELDLAGAERARRLAAADAGAARRQLNRLLGLPPDHALRLSASGKPLEVTLFEDIGDEDLKRRVLEGRFELRAKEAAYRRVEEELRLAVLRQYPRISLGPSYSHEPAEGNYLGVGASIEIPVFDRNQGEIAEKERSRERLRAEYSALLHRLLSGAFDARARARRARAEAEAQEREVLPLAARARGLFDGAFRAREVGAIEWAAAQERVARARAGHLRSLADYRKALIDLEAAAGGRLVPAGPDRAPEGKHEASR
jgi:outer membrane protein TolC